MNYVLTLILVCCGTSQHHIAVNKSVFASGLGRDPYYIENGATYVCKGASAVLTGQGATITGQRCVEKSIFYDGFDGR